MRWTAHAAGLVAASLSFAAAPATAQDVPVAFVHGFNADSAGWVDAARALASSYQIDPRIPNVLWQRRFENQRVTLAGKLGSGPGMPGVGHSNGGLVTRYYVGSSSYSRINRVLTLNSAHRGAPLAANVVNGKAKLFTATLVDAVAAPLIYQILPVRRAERVLGLTNGLAIGFNEDFDPLNAPVLHDMMPGSSFFGALDGAAGTERSRTLSRVGIGTAAKPDGIMCHGLWPEHWRGCNQTITVGKYLYLAAGVYNSAGGFFPLPGARPHLAPLWFYGSYRLARVNVDWLRLIGAGGTWNGITGRPDPSDGILPLATQQYPGASRQQNLTPDQGYNISHQEANDSSYIMLRTIGSVFEGVFDISVRTRTGEPVPPPEYCEPGTDLCVRT